MPRYEVFIPAAQSAGFNVTFRVDADNWMAALKTGMQKLGEQGANVQNILVDIQDDESVHVTDPSSSRVFRIRELTDEEVASVKPKTSQTLTAPPRGAHGAQTLVDEPRFSPGQRTSVHTDDKTIPGAPSPLFDPRRTVRSAEETVAARGHAVSTPASPQPAAVRPSGSAPAHGTAASGPRATASSAAPAQAPSPAPSNAHVTLAANGPAPAPHVASTSAALARPAGPAPTGASSRTGAPAAATVPHQAPVVPAPASHRNSRISQARSVVEVEAPSRPFVGKIGREARKNQKEEIDDLLAEVFERVQGVYAQKTTEAALYYLLDLALEKIPAEAGTVFHADAMNGDLTFRAVRGPRAKELLSAKIVIPAGEGVVGFCATEGVSLALSDVQKDPRYYAAVAEKVNYTPRSVLCAPMMTHGRTFGCLQILNKRDDSMFNAVEVGLASYVAHQAALYLNSR